MALSPRVCRKTLLVKGLLQAATASAILLIEVTSFGARLIEKRESANHVFTGKVETLHLQKINGYLNYTVDVAVTSIEKGDGIKVGQVVPVYCYLKDPDWLKDKSEEEKRHDALRRVSPGSSP